MKFKLNENIFDLLNKVELEEDLDLPIGDNQVLYEDDDFSKTPAQADSYRTTTEDILGFELNGNQVQYLATSWPEFYHNAEKYKGMKDQILGFMADEGLLSDEQLAKKDFNFDFDDNIDQTELDNFDQSSSKSVGNFTPLNVQSWESNKDTAGSQSELAQMAAEQVEDDDFDNEDAELLNNILNRNEKKD